MSLQAELWKLQYVEALDEVSVQSYVGLQVVSDGTIAHEISK